MLKREASIVGALQRVNLSTLQRFNRFTLYRFNALLVRTPRLTPDAPFVQFMGSLSFSITIAVAANEQFGSHDNSPNCARNGGRQD